MERIALFPGTFDPITLGHIDIIQRGIPLFDRLFIGVGINSSKVSMFSWEKRTDWIREIFQYSPLNIDVIGYEGLTVDCCRRLNANFILRGVRYVSDFEYEKSIADANRALSGIETVFLTCLPEYNFVASTLVRDIIKNKGDVSGFLHPVVLKDIK